MHPSSNKATDKANRYAVIISLYDQRPTEPLMDLLASMAQFPAGAPFDTVLVVNRDSEGSMALDIDESVRVIERNNSGMNIGAWSHGWRHSPGYLGYLFLQDECCIVRPNWLAAFANAASDNNTMVGESLNQSWNQSWEVLRETHGHTRIRDHYLNGQPANRIDVYLDFMRRHDISPGTCGLHLRSLVWFFWSSHLDQLQGFPNGSNFGECIGAEIGVSRQVIARGGQTRQVHAEPFQYIRHIEWNQKDPGGPFIHGQPFVQLEAPQSAAQRAVDCARTFLRGAFKIVNGRSR